jgi:hydrogenase maturation protease
VNLEPVEKIAEAVLYEGYMLYPYRPSSVKNQQRFNFGVLYPQAWCAHQAGSDRSCMQTECLLKASSTARLTIRLRFLQICRRSIGRVFAESIDESGDLEPVFEIVSRLEVAGRIYQPWQEAIEKSVTLADLDPHSPAPVRLTISLPEGRSIDYLNDEHAQPAGAIIREWGALFGSVEVESTACSKELIRITVRVENLTDLDARVPIETISRDAVLLDSLVSAHTILGVENGEFISLLEPAPGCEELATQCRNSGTWPVLAGDNATIMLSSPIILYDYPQIASESAGNLFDSTEIDEILSLRILTLTDDEKREMRQSDDRARDILDRTENMPEEQFLKLHGVLRGINALKERAP